MGLQRIDPTTGRVIPAVPRQALEHPYRPAAESSTLAPAAARTAPSAPPATATRRYIPPRQLHEPSASERTVAAGNLSGTARAEPRPGPTPAPAGARTETSTSAAAAGRQYIPPRQLHEPFASETVATGKPRGTARAEPRPVPTPAPAKSDAALASWMEATEHANYAAAEMRIELERGPIDVLVGRRLGQMIDHAEQAILRTHLSPDQKEAFRKELQEHRVALQQAMEGGGARHEADAPVLPHRP